MIRRKKVSAKKIIEKLFQPGDASKYITYDGIQDGDRVVLYCRVSTRQQNHSGNLDAQEQYLKTEMAKRGAKVVQVVKYVGSGFEPLRLPLAVKYAEQHRAKIVAISTDRFIRNEYFKSTGTKSERNARANLKGLETLKQSAQGIELVTLLYHQLRAFNLCYNTRRRCRCPVGGRQKGRGSGTLCKHFKSINQAQK